MMKELDVGSKNLLIDCCCTLFEEQRPWTGDRMQSHRECNRLEKQVSDKYHRIDILQHLVQTNDTLCISNNL